MQQRPPRPEEQSAADAIATTVDLGSPPVFEPNGASTAPDWRMQLRDGRTADVEVTTHPDGDMNSFFAELREKDGALKQWPDERLACAWTVMVVDYDPGYNKDRRRLKKLLADLAAVFAEVEKADGGPEQMQTNAQSALDGALVISRPSVDTVTVRDFPGMQIDDGQHSQRLKICAPPQRIGPKSGFIELIPVGGARGVSLGVDDLVHAVRCCIDAKTKKRQLDDAPDMKWLAVVLDGDAGIQLKHHYGGQSQHPHPQLDGISFDYFDEVWAIRPTQDDSWRGEDARIGPSYEPIFVVLRLSDGGETQRPYVVPRPEGSPSDP